MISQLLPVSLLHFIEKLYPASRCSLVFHHRFIMQLDFPDPLFFEAQIERKYNLLFTHLPKNRMKDLLYIRLVIPSGIKLQESDLSDIREVFLLVTLIGNDLKYTGFQLSSPDHIFS